MNRYLLTLSLCLCAVLCCGAPAIAAKVGTNPEARPLSPAAIKTLPEPARAPWMAYLARSDAARAADQSALAAERAALKGPFPPPPEESEGNIGMPLENKLPWYGSNEARHIADVIVSFQTPSGGWGKNVSRDGAARLPGQPYVADKKWNYVGTIDNGATVTEMRFLAQVAQEAPDAAGDAARAAVVKGIRYLLNAQYPNGGWPQVWPLQGSYHDAITFNDNAMANVIALLADVAANTKGFYGFLPADLRTQAARAVDKGLDCILRTQIVVQGTRTIWGQQHDPLTLEPVPARAFEPALPSTAESADLLIFLMSLPAPSPATIDAVNVGVRWLKQAGIPDHEWTKNRKLATRAGTMVWARFVAPATLKPRFGDRDRSISDDVNDLSAERHHGYAWYGTWPLKTFKRYVAWTQEHAPH
jgi:PelA/Pel-15E family pectate lyase